ncbi:MAG: GAF domain-containing protein, partial [Chloroflexota bacterium]
MNANVDQPVGNSQSRSFQSFVEAISRAMNLPASIWIPNDDKMAMRIDAAVGLSKEYVKKAELKLTETSVTGEAFLSGAAVTVYDILSDARWKYKDYAEEMGWKSALCVPIRVYGKIIGVISVYTFVNREFSENEKRLLEDYAAQIELTESYRRLFVLSENIERLITVEPKKVLEQIVRDACQVTGADAAVVYPFDPLREQFYDVDSVATFGLKHSLQLAEKPRIDKGMAAYIIHKGEAVFENIEVDEPKLIESSHFIQREEIKAFIGISLKVMDKVLGILYVDYRTPHNFSKGEKDTIRLFAHQAAIAVNNSRLFQQANLRADALEKLHQVGPDLLSITGEPRELESILNRIAQNAQTVLNADLVDLYQYDQSADEFVLPPVRVGRRLDKLVPKIIRDDDYVYDIVRTKKPTFTTDSQEEPILAKFKHEERARELGERFVFREQIKSTAALPMMVGQEVLGVIFVNFRIPQSFPEQQRELIGLFANQAAIAINNARLYQRTTVRAEALKSLHTVTSELVSITDAPKGLDKILNQIAESAHIVLGAELVDIYQYLQAENRFMLPPAKAGERIEPDIVKDKIYADDVLFVIVGGRVALYAQDARSSDAGLTSDFSSAERANLPRERFVVREKIASSASIPMIVNDEVVGVLFVNYRRSQSFLPPQRELIELFANQAAAAIRNARLYGEIQKRLGERLGDIETFREIYEKMHEGDLRAVLDLIAQKALGLTGAKYGGVWLLNKSHTSLTFGGLAGGAVTEAPPDLPVDAESENSINKQVVLTGKTYWCRDVNADDFYKEWYPDSRSEMAVPLKYQGRVIGTLNVESTVVDGFTEDHQKLLEALAGQAAIVVQNHRLVERLEILDRMGRELTSGIRLHENEILELIYQRASQLMDTDNMYIALYDDEEKLINFPVMYVEGKKKEQPDRKFGEGGIGKTEWIIQNKEPIFHAVKVEAEKWYKQPGRGDYFEKDRISLSSWVGVPMQVGEKVLGVIATYHPTLENLYGKDDLDVLSAMAR